MLERGYGGTSMKSLVYRYEECSKEQYEELLAKMPTSIAWDNLKEEDDNVEGAQTLACVAGHCEI